MKSIERIEWLYGRYLDGSATEQQEKELKELLAESDAQQLPPRLKAARQMLAGFDRMREREETLPAVGPEFGKQTAGRPGTRHGLRKQKAAFTGPAPGPERAETDRNRLPERDPGRIPERSMGANGLRRLAGVVSVAAVLALGITVAGILTLQDKAPSAAQTGMFACINGVEYTDPETARAELTKVLHRTEKTSGTEHALSKLKSVSKGLDLTAKPRIAGRILNEKLGKI